MYTEASLGCVHHNRTALAPSISVHHSHWRLSGNPPHHQLANKNCPHVPLSLHCVCAWVCATFVCACVSTLPYTCVCTTNESPPPSIRSSLPLVPMHAPMCGSFSEYSADGTTTTTTMPPSRSKQTQPKTRISPPTPPHLSPNQSPIQNIQYELGTSFYV